MAKPSLDEIANAMYDMVKEYDGKKNLKAGDLTKAMFGALRVRVPGR
jgi:hypothetical protein